MGEMEQSEQIERLRAGRLWYVATPYSRWDHGLEDAFRCACVATAKLMRNGVACISPIAHSHPIAHHGELDPLDHDFWMKWDKPIMEACSGLIVIRMPGYEQSRGVQAETRYFAKVDRPIEYVEWTE